MGWIKGQMLHTLPSSMEQLEMAEAQTEMLDGNSRAKAQLKKQLKQIRKRLEAQEKLAQEAKRRDIIRRLQESGWKAKNEE